MKCQRNTAVFACLLLVLTVAGCRKQSASVQSETPTTSNQQAATKKNPPLSPLSVRNPILSQPAALQSQPQPLSTPLGGGFPLSTPTAQKIIPQDDDGEAVFSETNVNLSVRWLRRMLSAQPTTTGNALADQQNRERFQKQLEQLTGKKISWLMTVATVGLDRLTLKPLDIRVFVQAHDLPGLFPTFRHSAADWISKLRPGSKVRLSGLLSDAKISGTAVILTVSEYAIESPDAPAAPPRVAATASLRPVKLLPTLGEEELRKQLLFAPVSGFDQQGATSCYNLLNATSPPDTGPRLYIKATAKKGVQMAWHRWPDCQVGKELAETLDDLSANLRVSLRNAVPTGNIRPDPQMLAQFLLQGRHSFLIPERRTVNAEDFRKPHAIPALTQLLQVENLPVRLLLVQLLDRIPGLEGSKALVQRALFDLSPQVREKAVKALARRPLAEFQAELLAAFSYPWPEASKHAANALLSIDTARQDKQLFSSLVELLQKPDPSAPFEVESKGKRLPSVRELRRINHMSNCVLCHAPSTAKTDLVRGRVPIPNEVPPPLFYAAKQGRLFIRADTTFLRPDFSVMQPVTNAGRWPGEQRFDYLTMVRQLTNKERLAWQQRQPKTMFPQKETLLFTLRELSGRDLGETYENWKTLPGSVGSKEKPNAPPQRDIAK